MHLVLNHMAELKEVGDTYRCWLVEALTSLSVIQICRAEVWHAGLVSPLTEVFKLCAVEDRGSELNSKLAAGSTENSLEYLAKVHT